MLRNNMPTNWEPPYPAWESFWEDTSEPLVAGYFGIQAHVPELLDEWASRAFNGAHAPFAVEKGLHVDRDGRQRLCLRRILETVRIPQVVGACTSFGLVG